MGTMTKWPLQKHTEHYKTRSIQRRNRHKEITIFCVFRIFLFFIIILKPQYMLFKTQFQKNY